VLLTLAAGLTLAANASAQTPSLRAASGQADYVPGQLVVRFNDELDDAGVASLLGRMGAREAGRSRFTRGLRVLSLPAGQSVEQAVSRYSAQPGVAWAEPNYLRRLSFTPNDPFFRFQWNFKLIGAERVWDIQKGKTEVVVAVLDSGVASVDKPSFLLNVEFEDGSERTFNVGPFRRAPDWGSTTFTAGYDAMVGLDFAWDDEGHGTHVASTIAESSNNGLGVTGLAFGVTLMPVKVCISLPFVDPDFEFCPSFAIAEGLDHARTSGAKVINMSLGGRTVSRAERDAVARAAGANIVIVAASGNDDGPVDFPAALDEVIAVGAVTARRQKAFYSNFGPELDLVAPGGDPREDVGGDGFPDFVFQQTFDPRDAAVGRYDNFGYLGKVGTSMASPHVAAAAALLISQGITSAQAVRHALEQSADDLGMSGRDDTFGHGLINLEKALSGLGLNR
jgi:serine protease